MVPTVPSLQSEWMIAELQPAWNLLCRIDFDISVAMNRPGANQNNKYWGRHQIASAKLIWDQTCYQVTGKYFVQWFGKDCEVSFPGELPHRFIYRDPYCE